MSVGYMHMQYFTYCLSQPLPEVPSLKHHNTTQRPGTVRDTLQSAIYCSHAISMQHWNFIIPNHSNLCEKLCFEAILKYLAIGGIMTTECKTGLLMVEPCCLSSTQCSAWQKEQTKSPNADNLWGGHALLYGILAHLDAGYMWDCAVHGLDLAPFAASLLVP